jgi:hypothetical protein
VRVLLGEDEGDLAMVSSANATEVRQVRASLEHGLVRTEHDLAGPLAVSAARRMAEALIVGFGRCRVEGRMLNELQTIDMLTAALLCFEGHTDELAGMLEADGLLRLNAEAAELLGEEAP